MSDIEWHNRAETRVYHMGVGQDWTEWFTSGWKWRNFTFVNLSFELDGLLGGFEVRAGLLGVRFWFNTYDCGPGSKIEELTEMKDDWLERHTAPDPHDPRNRP